MYTFELSNKFLSAAEKKVFENYLDFHDLDRSIWEVYDCLFKSSVKNTTPLLLRVFKESELYAAAIIIKCSKYGKSLFNNPVLSGAIDKIKIPFYLWVKFGACMDMMSNIGFIKDPEKSNEVYKIMVNYLKENSLLTIVNDYSENYKLYETASILPALPHALIECGGMDSIDDYNKNHKNIKRKIKGFKKNGGSYERIDTNLSKEQITSLKACFLSTVEKSVFYLPYQELYLNSALKTSATKIDKVHYFVATLNGEFLGYQAAIETGKYLNALHGAFNRNYKTTFHAYDILFVKMTEYAIEKGLKIIDFGAVLNFTKQKMINKSIEMSYFVLSKNKVIQSIFKLFLKITKIQGSQQMKFR